MRYVKILLLILTVILFNSQAKAENYSVHGNGANSGGEENYFNEIYDIAGADNVKENLPDAVGEYLPDGEKIELTPESVKSVFDFGYIFNLILKILGFALPVAAKNFMPILAAVIFGAILSYIKNLYESASGSLGEITDFVIIVIIAGITFGAVRECFYVAKHFLEEIGIYMGAMMPVMASLSALSGNIATAAANSAGLYLVLNAVEIIAANVILPVLSVCFAFSLVQSLVNTVNISGIASYIRSVVNFIFVFIMSTFITILLFQTILTSSADNLASRTVKFTVSSFLPVVGGLIGEASRTVIGSIQAVKSVTGVFGVLVIIITLLPPLLNVIISKFMLKICGAVALVLGMDKHASFLKEMNSLLDITLAIMVSVAVVFIFTVTIFIKTAAA